MKKIAILTGTRAEYGLFYPLIKKLKTDKSIETQIIVTGMHLSPKFGLTYREILEDGFKINKKVDIHLSNDSDSGIIKSMSIGLVGNSKTLDELKPDMILLLGDRFETFAGAIAAYIKRIPIAHMHGGETTEGAFDEGVRHSITKMSFLHFVSTETYKKRVIQLGENPKRVFNVGAIGIDNIRTTRPIQKNTLEKHLKFKFGKKNIVVTFHPVTLENNTAETQFLEILKTFDKFKNLNIIFTKPNADTNRCAIVKLIDNYVKKHNDKTISFDSLGRLKYLSILANVDAVVGNSSSGIIEAPSFGIPTVNIGDRQKGRVQAGSVIDCSPQYKSVLSALNKAFSKKFVNHCKNIINPYGDGFSANRIYNILKLNINQSHNIKKRFYDLKHI